MVVLVENMVSFTVTEALDGVSSTITAATTTGTDSSSSSSLGNTHLSLGSQLTALCVPYPNVAQGFLLWATERAERSDFCL